MTDRRRRMDPRSASDWIFLVGAPAAGVAWASYLVASRARIEPFDVTLVVTLLGARYIGRPPRGQ